jgi:Bor protein
MSVPRRLASIMLLTASAACYHATVETGAAPSTVKIRRPWAASWIYGLVPPKPTLTSERCPAGVAKVETRHSFFNQVVGALTGGIFTPMQIVVTCAAAADSAAPRDSATTR